MLICVTSVPRQIVDGDVVRAAQGVDVDGLDIVNVHDDAADVAGEQNAATVGRDLEALVRGAAVEQQGVDAVLTLDHVAAVARIPLEHVVAGAEQGSIVALVAVDEVVAVAAEKEIGPVAAEDGVVAGAAVDRHADEGRQIAGGAEAVVAAVHVEHKLFGGPDVDAERRGIEAIEPHARAVGGSGEDLRAVAAVDLDGIGAVAALGQIGVVARIPDHAVVAGLAEHLVVTVAAGERVVAVAAVQKVGAVAANEGVVARTAIEGKLS